MKVAIAQLAGRSASQSRLHSTRHHSILYCDVKTVRLHLARRSILYYLLLHSTNEDMNRGYIEMPHKQLFFFWMLTAATELINTFGERTQAIAKKFNGRKKASHLLVHDAIAYWSRAYNTSIYSFCAHNYSCKLTCCIFVFSFISLTSPPNCIPTIVLHWPRTIHIHSFIYLQCNEMRGKKSLNWLQWVPEWRCRRWCYLDFFFLFLVNFMCI